MELDEAVRQRRMVRSFADRPLPGGMVDRLVDQALRAPTAGHTRGTAWVVLEGKAETRRYWEATTTEDWRARSPRWAGLSRAPAVAVAVTWPQAYVARYGAPDKASAGLGAQAGADEAAAALERWPVPYWHADAAFGVMTLLLGATAQGLGACFLGAFRGQDALLNELGVPEGWRLFGAVAVGYPDGGDRASASLGRPGPSRKERLHHGRWQTAAPSLDGTVVDGASASAAGGHQTARQ